MQPLLRTLMHGDKMVKKKAGEDYLHSIQETRGRRLILMLPYICSICETNEHSIRVQHLGRRNHLLSLACIVLKVPAIVHVHGCVCVCVKVCLCARKPAHAGLRAET